MAHDVSLLLNVNIDGLFSRQMQPWLVNDPDSVAKWLLFAVAEQRTAPVSNPLPIATVYNRHRVR